MLQAFLHLGVSLMFRISYDKSANIGEVLKANQQYLDREFPNWGSDTIISNASAAECGGALKRVNLARKIYNMHLMSLALRVYRAMISMGCDIKW